MKARKRFLLIVVAFFAILFFAWNGVRRQWRQSANATTSGGHYYSFDFDGEYEENSMGSECRMESCFDLNKCHENGLKVHIYPEFGLKLNPIFAKIVEIIKSSKYYEKDAKKGFENN
ncbi:unnamed protein product [Medioppia subpectinata]|uniref:Uncharacterized protein n=1 Tax=Medioppia subpectinata TaxID=1979941 RepID=A0A7R9Q7D1_9ACAR|nr:unnamed protein product [Medioppia subpectinata]CAG2115437.1 unnamed protein product [Medioppia subpectinata]